MADAFLDPSLFPESLHPRIAALGELHNAKCDTLFSPFISSPPSPLTLPAPPQAVAPAHPCAFGLGEGPQRKRGRQLAAGAAPPRPLPLPRKPPAHPFSPAHTHTLTHAPSSTATLSSTLRPSCPSSTLPSSFVPLPRSCTPPAPFPRLRRTPRATFSPPFARAAAPRSTPPQRW